MNTFKVLYNKKQIFKGTKNECYIFLFPFRADIWSGKYEVVENKKERV